MTFWYSYFPDKSKKLHAQETSSVKGLHKPELDHTDHYPRNL